MEREEENKNKIPSRMSRIAFPKAKYGFFLAIALILFILIILYKDSIL
jgi:cell division protein FtsL